MMFNKSTAILAALAASFFTTPTLAHNTPRNINDEQQRRRKLSGKGKGKSKMDDRMEDFTLTVTNLAVRQPFSPFFVMVHDSSVRLYEFGEPASSALATLAEDGNAMPLVEQYSGMYGVLSAVVHNTDAPYFGGDSTDITVTVSKDYPYVTIASMAINTNDCIVTLNSVKVYDGQMIMAPGLDAGSEENNENCNSIPGPACASINTTNVASGNGEGFVHVHPGFFGVGDLSQSRYDWRNPMMRVKVKESDMGY